VAARIALLPAGHLPHTFPRVLLLVAATKLGYDTTSSAPCAQRKSSTHREPTLQQRRLTDPSGSASPLSALCLSSDLVRHFAGDGANYPVLPAVRGLAKSLSQKY